LQRPFPPEGLSLTVCGNTDVFVTVGAMMGVFERAARTDLSIADESLSLGYSEHTNFTRAFTCWTD